MLFRREVMMFRYAANLAFLYQDLPFYDRFPAAASDGFAGVEVPIPYTEPVDRLAAALTENGLELALINLPAGDWPGGDRGIGALPGREAEFRAGVDAAIRTATALGCRRANVLAGIAPTGIAAAELEDILVGNLAYAGPRFAAAGIRLLLEPINTRDIPGFIVTTTRQAERILDRVGSDNLFIQYDIYHAQVSEGDLVPTFARLKHRIGHIQVADTPGRNEPGTGEIAYPFVFAELARLGYSGWIGAEYKPKAGTSAGLAWMRA
jgi:hydroxypyruvate isomerase